MVERGSTTLSSLLIQKAARQGNTCQLYNLALSYDNQYDVNLLLWQIREFTFVHHHQRQQHKHLFTFLKVTYIEVYDINFLFIYAYGHTLIRFI